MLITDSLAICPYQATILGKVLKIASSVCIELCIEWNALEKFTNECDLEIFAFSPSMIQRITRIYKVLDWFFKKSIWIFPKNFFNFSSDTIEQALQTLAVMASVVLSNSESCLSPEKKDPAFHPLKKFFFFYYVLFIDSIA